MHGQLTARSVPDVCRELAEAGATGVLHIAGVDAAGRLVFDGGRLVGASSPTPGSRLGDRLVNGGLLDEAVLQQVLDEQRDTPESERPRLGQLLVDRGLVPIHAVRLVVQEQLLDAVFDLTDWRLGTYRFEADAEPETPEVPLAIPVDQALIEVSRRREEWEAVSEVIPDLDAVPRFREGASTSTADLEPDEFAVMASVDGARSVRDLAYDLGYGEFEAARVVYALTLLGLVEVELPVDEIGAALDDALAYVGGTPDGGDRGEEADDAAGGADEPVTAAREWGGDPDDDLEPAPWDSWEHLAPEPDAPGTAADRPDTGGAQPAEPPAVGHAPPSGWDREPAAESDDATLEADLPDLSVFDELDVGDDPRQGEPTAHTPDPRYAPDAGRAPDAGAAVSGAAAPDAAVSGAADDEPPSAPPSDDWRPGKPTPDGDGDVSEFLRELSRLALDDEPEEEAEAPASDDPPRQSPPRPRPAPESREEPKRKKRGLFGFGG